MTRYAKVDRRIYGDERMRRLSPIPPCGAGLWIYLLTTPHAGSIPGVIVAGEAMLAEALRWPVKGFREGFAELSREGMADADWEARLIWLPKAIGHNMPENPNVVRSWRAQWDEVPECALKLTAWQGLFDALAARETWSATFVQACAKPVGKGMPKGIANRSAYRMANQEQEQEQEQEQYQILLDADAPSGIAAPKPKRRKRETPAPDPLPWTLADLEAEFRGVLEPERCQFGPFDPRLGKPLTSTLRAFVAAGYTLEDVRLVAEWVRTWSPGIGVSWGALAIVGKLTGWASKARAWDAGGRHVHGPSGRRVERDELVGDLYDDTPGGAA